MVYDRAQDPKFIAWSKKVKQKDDFQCQICFKENVYLESHHLKNFADYPLERFNVDNGVCLCKTHHIQFHNLFGKSFNTPQQFDQFKKIFKLLKNVALKSSSRQKDGYVSS